MQKPNFDKGRAERQKRLEKFREKPVKSPGKGLEQLGTDMSIKRRGQPPGTQRG